MSKSKKILFLLSGSIASYKACQLISMLVKAGYAVQPAATENVSHFVGWATLEGLTGNKVIQSIFEEGRAMDHIHLARESDLILLCPATANTLNRLSAGLADDIIGALFLANNFKKPFWIAPAMNTEMYDHPTVKNSLQLLESWGAKIFETQSGRLACGEVGQGKLVEPEIIFNEVEKYFKKAKK